MPLVMVQHCGFGFVKKLTAQVVQGISQFTTHTGKPSV